MPPRENTVGVPRQCSRADHRLLREGISTGRVARPATQFAGKLSREPAADRRRHVPALEPAVAERAERVWTARPRALPVGLRLADGAPRTLPRPFPFHGLLAVLSARTALAVQREGSTLVKRFGAFETVELVIVQRSGWQRWMAGVAEGGAMRAQEPVSARVGRTGTVARGHLVTSLQRSDPSALRRSPTVPIPSREDPGCRGPK